MPELHFFQYDLRELPLNPLKRTSVAGSVFSGDGKEFLKLHRYTEVPSRGSAEHIKLYQSDEMNDRYLIIASIEHYRFVIWLHDDQALLAWRREYEQIPASFLAKKLLPEPSSPPEYTNVPMNMAVFRGRI